MLNGIEENIDIEIFYNHCSKEIKEGLRILGYIFVYNNKDKCKIIYKDKEYDLKEYFEDIDNNYNHKEEFT